MRAFTKHPFAAAKSLEDNDSHAVRLACHNHLGPPSNPRYRWEQADHGTASGASYARQNGFCISSKASSVQGGHAYIG